ncbi:MAG: ribonuclease P protein component [bacterium]
MGDAETIIRDRALDLGLSREQRIRSGALFQDAYAQGRVIRGRLMVLYPRSGLGAALRLGVVASRKVGGAVERARAKRRLRAAWRMNRAHFHGAADLIVVARRDLLVAPWSEVVDEMRRLGRRAGLVAREGGER